jgi:hypothetical protein
VRKAQTKRLRTAWLLGALNEKLAREEKTDEEEE